MNNLCCALYLLCGNLTASLYTPTIFKTVMPDGTVVYSDTPSENSVPIELNHINTVVIPKISMVPNKIDTVKSYNTHYQINIVSPRPQETIRNNSGTIDISFEVTPEYEGDVHLLLDNAVLNTQGEKHLSLKNIERGAHTLEVQLCDNSGKIFASSGQQTFYLHQASALINAN